MLRILAVFALSFLAVGCTGSRGYLPISNSSLTQLDKGNYKIVQSNLRGEASCAYLLGMIPLGEPAIATEAMNQVVNAAQLDGERKALVNFAFDQTVSQYLVIKVLTVIVRADVAQFD